MIDNSRTRIITVIPCTVPLTMVYLEETLPNKDGLIAPKPRYEPVVAIMYRTNDSGEALTPVPLYSGDYVRFIQEHHRPGTHADGSCFCGRNKCGDFGVLPGTPEELWVDSDLTDDIGRRTTHLIAVNARETEKKEKARVKAKLNARKKRAEQLAKEAAAPVEEPQSKDVGPLIPARARTDAEKREYHALCGKPLPRSIEELESFEKQWGPAGQPPGAPPWWCTCGQEPETTETNASIFTKLRDMLP